ncbi:putative protein FAM47C [Scyliorhinus canicula]|uniref:putative protein FAM47C n=1 Tax=Scyliorhinus canicula TaxID=7830 RepID=UPI0018F77939|nr:putative protein FAM47C [Scyliorhinus canicula]
MAHKYDTLLVEKPQLSKIRSDQEPLPRPWYKERIKTKILRKNNLQSVALNGHRWRFLKNGLDDFRDGFPPQSQEDLAIIQSEKGAGLSPFLKNVAESFKPAQRVSKRLTNSQICFSKSLPLPQTRREQMEEIEYVLSQHPLALYPHLEEGMSPELFEEIVGILDPEMVLSGEDICEGLPAEEKAQVTKLKEDKARSTKCSEDSEESKNRNPYKWILFRGTQKEDQKTKLKWDTSPQQDEEIKQITKEFCDWVTSLGGENNNIEEATIMGLFASDYETSNSLAIPIKVMELTNIPGELRMIVGVPPPKPSAKIRKTTDLESTQVNGFKCIYGAWYMNPKTWRKRKVDEPLLDPSSVALQTQSHLPEGTGEMDEVVRRLHATISFLKYVKAQGHRKPEFLEKIFAAVKENPMDNYKNK